MTKGRRILIGAAVVVVALTLTGIAVANQADAGPEVVTEKITRRDLVSKVTASGYIQAKRKVDISADISGRVTELFVEEGQRVEQGDVLLRIDPTSFEANVRRATASVAQARAQAAQAEANLVRARSELKRAEQLSQGANLISSAELEQARTNVTVTEAQFEAAQYGVAQADAGVLEAQEQLGKTTIVAPMSGQVTRLNIEVGETAIVGTMNNAGSLLLTIADLSDMEARIRVGETDIPEVKIGDRAEVRIDAYPEEVFSGRVTSIANSAVNAPSDRSSSASAQQSVAIDFEVVVALDDPPLNLRPDLSATAEVITAERTAAIAVPIIAVTVRDENGETTLAAPAEEAAPTPVAEASPAEVGEVEGVFVLEEGKPVWVPVEIGIVGDWYFEVVSGLEGGETVIAGPYAAVRDLRAGQTVRVTGTNASAAPQTVAENGS